MYQTIDHEGPMELLSTQGNLAPGPDGPLLTYILYYQIMDITYTEPLVSCNSAYRCRDTLTVVDARTMTREPTDTEFVAQIL